MYNAIQYLLAGNKSDTSLLSNITTFSDFLDKRFLREEYENAAGRKKPIVIIFDQLEELFRLSQESSRENQQDFFNQIANALDNENLPLRIVLVIREDYLAHLDPFGSVLPEKLRPRFRLEPLDREEAKEAIERPLEKSKEYFKDYGKRVDGLLKGEYEHHGDKEAKTVNGKSESQSLGIVDKIVRYLCTMYFELPGGRQTEVIGEFVEPIYLQIVGQRLWKKLISAPSNDNKLDYLEEVGNVGEALEGFYVDSIHEASNQTGVSEDKIREWCEVNLITSRGLGNYRDIVHRGFNRTGGIPNSAVDILEKKYLVRRVTRAGAPWYELTHDRLIEPIKNSNKEWRVKQDQLRYVQEKKKKNLVLVITIPSLVIAVIIILYLLNSYYVATSSRVTVDQPVSISINPSINMLYVANFAGDTVSVIDGKTNTVIRNIKVGSEPSSVSVNPVTNIVYVTNGRDNTVSVIDGKTNTVIRNIKVGTSPYGVSVNPVTNMVYVANRFHNTVSVIDGKTNTVISTINVGVPYEVFRPNGVSVNPVTNTIYVANYHENAVYVIDGKTNTVIHTIYGINRVPGE